MARRPLGCREGQWSTRDESAPAMVPFSLSARLPLLAKIGSPMGVGTLLGSSGSTRTYNPSVNRMEGSFRDELVRGLRYPRYTSTLDSKPRFRAGYFLL